METRRYINVRTWSETWFEELSATEKLVWIYLNTNSSTNMLGAYSTSIRRLAYECHVSEPAARRSIKKLEVVNKLIYQDGYVIIIDWMAQQSMNPSMRISARKEYDKLPEKIRLLLSEQTHEAIKKTRQLSEQDATPVPDTDDFPQGEKEEEKGNYEQEQEEERTEQEQEMSKQEQRMPKQEQQRMQGQEWEAGNCEEDSLPPPHRTGLSQSDSKRSVAQDALPEPPPDATGTRKMAGTFLPETTERGRSAEVHTRLPTPLRLLAQLATHFVQPFKRPLS